MKELVVKNVRIYHCLWMEWIRIDILEYKEYKASLREFASAAEKIGGGTKSMLLFVDFKGDHKTIAERKPVAERKPETIHSEQNKEEPKTKEPIEQSKQFARKIEPNRGYAFGTRCRDCFVESL